MRALLAAAIGKKIGRIRKLEYVYFAKDHVVISLTKIGKDLFLEVEAHSRSQVKRLANQLFAEVKMNPEYRSLFEIYIHA